MHVLLDNGHGGIINGEYQTPGKRSPVWSDGSQLFEGEFNRAIVQGIADKLTQAGVRHTVLVAEDTDVPLSERVQRANALNSDDVFFVSVHSNAGGGSGFEVFTSPGDTRSDTIATLFGEEFLKVFPDRKLRSDFSDGDLDKEQRFYVLTKTAMPAVLTENFFMDNKEECKTLLMTQEGRQKIIDFHVNAIMRAQSEIFAGTDSVPASDNGSDSWLWGDPDQPQ